MFSTSGDVQYIGGVQYIRGYHEYIGGYLEYIRRCSVHWGDTVSARSEFWGVASRVPWGWRDSFGKTGNLAGWVTKVCLKCTEKLG